MRECKQHEDFESALDHVRVYDPFELTALMVGLDPQSPEDREWVLAIVSDDYEGETPDDLLPESTMPADRAAAWRVFFTLEALLVAGHLKLSGKYVRSQKRKLGAVATQVNYEKNPDTLGRDRRIYEAVRRDGKRGAVARVAKRFGMTPQNVGLRKRAYEAHLQAAEQADMSERKLHELRKRKKDV